MAEQRQMAEQIADSKQVSTKRVFPVYRANPSVPSPNGLPTRSKRFHVPGGKASKTGITPGPDGVECSENRVN
jgi:hypothetical protein